MYSSNNISNVIKEHFSFVTDKQLEQFEVLPSLYADWNEKVHVVSPNRLLTA